MWKLSIEDDQGAITVVQLARNEYTIGRGEENTIRLTERNISRRHARLVKRGSDWFLLDLGSYNGCFVNGIRAGETQPVVPRDLIQVGDYRLEFITDESLAVTSGGARTELSTSTVTGAATSTHVDRLVMVVGPTPGRAYPLTERSQNVGRGDDCDIPVNHPSVSRLHAEIHYLKDHHYEIIDKNSSNGLRINGVDLERGLIEAHDVIEFGDVILRFVPAGQSYRPTPEETEKLTKLLGVNEGLESLSHTERLKLAWSGMSKTVRFGVSLLGMMVVLMFIAVVVTGRPLRSTAKKAPLLQPTAVDPNAKFVQQAKERLAANELDKAHDLASQIAPNSECRHDPIFAEIESRWTEQMFVRADKATTNEERRAIYSIMLNDTALNATNRSRAQVSLAALNDAAVTNSRPSTEPEPAASQGPEPAKAQVESNSLARNKATGSDTASPLASRSTTAKTAAAASPNAASAAARKMAGVLAEKNQLKAKVATGNSTDQERRLLRALCRQLNDASCSR